MRVRTRHKCGQCSVATHTGTYKPILQQAAGCLLTLMPPALISSAAFSPAARLRLQSIPSQPEPTKVRTVSNPCRQGGYAALFRVSAACHGGRKIPQTDLTLPFVTGAIGQLITPVNLLFQSSPP
jgi:hypothetical protein